MQPFENGLQKYDKILEYTILVSFYVSRCSDFRFEKSFVRTLVGEMRDEDACKGAYYIRPIYRDKTIVFIKKRFLNGSR